MNIAVLGPGGIGSTFALHLAQAGHEVTVIGRGKRLEQLQRDPAIVDTAGRRAAVRVGAALDVTTAYDLVLVTMLASQVDAVLPLLGKSAAKRVMFMFNTFEPLARLRDAVGAARFAFGFPAILATVDEGKLTSQVVTRPFSTTVSDAEWAQIFTAAGIASVVEHDMESWLRTHAAFVAPFMVAAVTAYQRRAGITWSEAMRFARALREGFELVKKLGHAILPASMVTIGRLPQRVVAAMLWGTTRVPSIRRTGAAGLGEPRTLIEQMTAAAPGQTSALLSILP